MTKVAAPILIYMNGAPPAPCVGVHGHHCPECFEVKLCVETCTREGDLEDDGVQMGAHATCDDCRRQQ